MGDTVTPYNPRLTGDGIIVGEGVHEKVSVEMESGASRRSNRADDSATTGFIEVGRSSQRPPSEPVDAPIVGHDPEVGYPDDVVEANIVDDDLRPITTTSRSHISTSHHSQHNSSHRSGPHSSHRSGVAYSHGGGGGGGQLLSDEELARRLQAGEDVLQEDADIARRIQETQALEAEPVHLPRQHMMRQMSSFAAWQVDKVKTGVCFGEATSARFCWAMLILCVLMFIAEMAVADWQIVPFSVNPTIGPNAQVLLILGAKRTDLILAGEWWRLIAPMFLHGGVIHLVFNSMGLVNIGFPLEHEFGTAKIAYIYLTSGFAGEVFSAIFLPNTVGVGASGAIFGLFGAAWADLIQNWGIYKQQEVSKKMLCQLLFSTVLNLGLGLMPFLDNFAHLGGMLTGLFTGLTVLVQDRYTREGAKKGKKDYQACLQICSLAMTPIAILVGLVVLYLNVNAAASCPWCKYISCVPSPWWFCDDCGNVDLNQRRFESNGTFVIKCPFTDLQVYQPSTAQTITADDLLKLCRTKCPGQQ